MIKNIYTQLPGDIQKLFKKKRFPRYIKKYDIKNY